MVLPFDDTRVAPTVTRATGSGYSVARIDGKTSYDVAIASNGENPIAYLGPIFHGKAAWYRWRSGVFSEWFVRQDRHVQRRFGDADWLYVRRAVSVWYNGTDGRIWSPGATVTFYGPNIQSVLLDGEIAPRTDRATDG